MLSEEDHYRLLKALQENPQVSQRELSRTLDISLGKVNYCLKSLIRSGLVKVDNFRTSRNKSAYVYLLTPQGLRSKSEVAVAFLRRKQREYDVLQEEIEDLRREIIEHNGAAD